MDVVAISLVVTALFAYVNHRFIGLPTTIGVMGLALALSLALLGLHEAGITSLKTQVGPWLESVDFSELLMQGMLSMLLFAGALHVDLSELKARRWQVAVLAVGGTFASAALMGLALVYVLPALGIHLPLLYCLAFGALISPTDPIAVMGMIKSVGAPKSLEIIIAGESLFNDGIGVVLFTILAIMLGTGAAPTLSSGALLLFEEAGGGILYGLVLGYLSFWLMGGVDSYVEEVLLTLATVIGGYALAGHLHVSGPLAMVVAGLIIGNHGRTLAMSDVTRRYVDMFWELIDSILNSVLFVLIGLEVLLIDLPRAALLPALVTIALTLVVRLVTVALPVAALRRWFALPPRSWQVLTWGGLRGGISIALALSLPVGPERNVVLALTYAVVVFSILAQGLSMRALTRRAMRPAQ